MKIEIYGSRETTGQLVINIRPENDIETSLLEAFEGYSVPMAWEGDRLVGNLNIANDQTA